MPNSNNCLNSQILPGMNSYLKADEIKLVHSGHNYFEILTELIENCKETLHLQTYIFDLDEIGKSIISVLKKAAARNVKVYILVDAFGSNSFPSETIKELNQCGVHFRLFSPLFSSESIYFGRRLHHKIGVADKKTALIGGINIAEKYYGRAISSSAWLDYAILIEGDVCEYLHLLCEQFFFKRRFSGIKRWERKTSREINVADPKLIRFRRNDWIKRKNEIYKSYIEAIRKAEKSIIIVASYFLPGYRLRKLLRAAARRSVDIKIIVAGKSDVGSVRLVELYLYDFYLKNNIQIYEWTNSVMHGKAMVVDNKWTTIGSYNLNYLSRYISIELNADVVDQEFLDDFSKHLNNIIKQHCIEVDYENNNKKNGAFMKLKMLLAYWFYKILKEFVLLGNESRNRK